jgi:orotate phosphoribosyltransferase
VDHDLLQLTIAREGHFRLESGHHGGRWLDLDGLFRDPARLAPSIAALAGLLRPLAPDVVCGPLVGGALVAQAVAASLGVELSYTERFAPAEPAGMYGVAYRVPRGLRAHLAGKRVAIVDDAISAGSAVRATFTEVVGLGGQPVAVGALLLLGRGAAPFFEQAGVPLSSVLALSYDLHAPDRCPMCAAGLPLEDPLA